MIEGKKTKDKLAQALLKLVEKKDFTKISISDITQATGLNRQTFYYHFKDKEDLLHYSYFVTGLNYLQADDLSLDNWEEAVLKMLRTMEKYQTFYFKTVTSDSEVLIREFTTLTKGLFVRLFEDVDHEAQLSTADKDFYSRFLAYGCGGILVDWLLKKVQATPLEIAAQLFRFAKDIEFFAYRLYQSDTEKSD